MIKIIAHVALDHSGGYYLYRLNQAKIERLCGGEFQNLQSFLNAVFSNCPDDYFRIGPRSSALKFKIKADLIEVRGHEVSALAQLGLENNRNRFRFKFSEAHQKVQTFMIENDSNTIATEVPIWIEANELEGFSTLFKSDFPLTGHIDILRVEDGKIWIWDYKPKAHREKYAATQTFFYALMLSKRTGIELERFRCGYFDSSYAFLFKPEERLLIKNANIQSF